MSAQRPDDTIPHQQETEAVIDKRLEVALSAQSGSGPDYHVFEVTDLVIPTGTDWSGLGHVIGEFPLISFAEAMEVALRIEADPLPANFRVALTIADDPDWNVDLGEISAAVTLQDTIDLARSALGWDCFGSPADPTNFHTFSSPAFDMYADRYGNRYRVTSNGLLASGTIDRSPKGTTSETLYVVVHTSDVTDQDITVQARAAIQVL